MESQLKLVRAIQKSVENHAHQRQYLLRVQPVQ